MALNVTRNGVNAIIAVVGLAAPLSLLVTHRPRAPADAESADKQFGALRQHLIPGSRVGYLVPSADPGIETAMHLLAQYALAPAVVVPIRAGELNVGGACGPLPEGLPIITPVSTESSELLVRLCGLHVVVNEGAAVLFGRPP
jgi:hypothetical protein